MHGLPSSIRISPRQRFAGDACLRDIDSARARAIALRASLAFTARISPRGEIGSRVEVSPLDFLLATIYAFYYVI